VRAGGRAQAATLAALAAVYFAAGKLGLSLALVHASASAVWPPTGIALAAFLVLGRGVWPAILAGAFLVNVTTEGSAATSLGIAVGNTLEGLVGALLVERFAGGRRAFDRPQDVFGFVTLAGLVATAISPSFGVTSLCLGGFAPWSEYGAIWLTWWLGDAGGAIVVAPALILWAVGPRPRWSRVRRLEAGAALVAIAAIGEIVFGGLFASGDGYSSLRFLCLPLAIWLAFRFGPREAATAVLVLGAVAVAGTLRRGEALPGSGQNESLVLLQLFLGTLAVTSLTLAAVVAERQRALAASRRQALELARANAELDEFAHVVSHDLKAPLRGVSSLAAWIAEDCKELLQGESREHLRLLEERARRMSRLIDGVLRYSRAGKSAGVRPVDAQALFAEVVDSLGPLRGVSVRVEGTLPVVRCDRTQLAQILQNLIGNAVEHLGRPSGEVVVACREGERDFEWSVRDDGVGIDAPHRERIFRMFHAVDPERGGSGVGLAIVKKLVERAGGSVSVESAPGAGSTFRFSIPK
jgi:signal transduction histidine kinase